MRKVVIIGAGLSGLTTSVLLTELGYEVNLIEAKSFSGGRAYSFLDRISGIELDNGQHIMMGCYPYTLKFLEKIGSIDKIIRQENFTAKFISADKKSYSIKCPNFPAPFHLLSGLFTYKYISNKDRLKLASTVCNIYLSKIFNTKCGLNTLDFLKKTRQSEKAIQKLWEPIIISAMNGKPENISANLFRNTIFEMFLKSRENSQVILPKTRLSKLFIEPAERFITERGGKIFHNSRVTRFFINNDVIENIELENGKIIKGDIYFSALPYQKLIKFENVVSLSGLKISKFRSSPIISIYLWLKEPAPIDNFIYLLNSNAHVVFNISTITNNGKVQNILCVVISAANSLINYDKEHILYLIMKELYTTIGVHSDSLLGYKIIKERNATLLITPETENNRPDQKTILKNFYLTGDWVNTKLPATIESAIKSGYNIISII